MILGTLAQISLLFAIALSFSCSSGANLNGSNEKKKVATDDKSENKRVSNDNSDAKAAEIEEDDDDLSVIPPEVVSAAYLTCSTTDTETTPEEGDIHLGCNITKKDGNRLEVNQEQTEWNLTSRDGKEIDYEELVTLDAAHYQRIFRLSKVDYEYGVNPTVKVAVSDGSTITVKKPAVVRIDGKEKTD